MTPSARGLAAGVMLATALTACATGSHTQELTALPACGDPPAAIEPSRQVPLPRDAVVVWEHVDDPLTNALAYAPLTPVEVREHYEQRDDVRLLHSEDEVFEAELLMTDGTHRTFVRASAICRRGSNLLIVVAPDSAATALPQPGSGLQR